MEFLNTEFEKFLSVNASFKKYTVERKKLFYLWNLCGKQKNVLSHTIVRIRPAVNGKDYYFQPEFRHKAIMVELVFDKKSCEMCNCLPIYPRNQKCSQFDDTIEFQSGNTTYLACQPSCFNLSKHEILSQNLPTTGHVLQPRKSHNLIKRVLRSADTKRSDNSSVGKKREEKKEDEQANDDEEEKEREEESETDEKVLPNEKTLSNVDYKQSPIDGSVQAPTLRWSESLRKCMYENLNYLQYGFDDSIRSNNDSSIIVPWVNNIGTGFDTEIVTDKNGNEYRKFIINKYYCDALGLTYEKLEYPEIGGKCVENNFRYIFTITVSDTLWRLGEMVNDYFLNDLSPRDIRKHNIPNQKKGVPEYLKNKKVWFQHIDRNFKPVSPLVNLNDLGFDKIPTEEWQYYIWTTEVFNEKTQSYGDIIDIRSDAYKLMEKTAPIYYKQDDKILEKLLCGFITIDTVLNSGEEKSEEEEKIEKELQKKQYEKELSDLKEYFKKIYNFLDENLDIEKKMDFISSAIQYMFSLEGLKMIFLNYVSDVALASLHKTLLLLGEKMLPQFLKFFLHNTSKVSIVFLRPIIQNVIRYQAVRILFQQMVKFGIKLSFAGASLTSIVGAVVFVLGIVDLIVSYYDPFHVNEQIDQKILDAHAENMLKYLKEMYSRSNAGYTPFYMCLMNFMENSNQKIPDIVDYWENGTLYSRSSLMGYDMSNDTNNNNNNNNNQNNSNTTSKNVLQLKSNVISTYLETLQNEFTFDTVQTIDFLSNFSLELSESTLSTVPIEINESSKLLEKHKSILFSEQNRTDLKNKERQLKQVKIIENKFIIKFILIITLLVLFSIGYFCMNNVAMYDSSVNIFISLIVFVYITFSILEKK